MGVDDELQAVADRVDIGGHGDQSLVSWSPDGSQISFTMYGGGDNEIWIMDADGSNRRNVTDNSDIHDGGADW